MPFPPSAACRFFDLPPVNLQNLPLHLTKNSFASAPTHLCGVALVIPFSISTLSYRTNYRIKHRPTQATKHSIAASSSSRFSQRSAAIKFSPKRNSSRRLCQPPGTRTSSKNPHRTFAGGTKSVKTNQLEPQPLFGREGSGGRGASLREAASPPRKSRLTFPKRKSSRRLCQPPGTRTSSKEPPHPFAGGTKSVKTNQLEPQPLFGREGSGGRGASLREAASPPRNSHVTLQS